jgi:REP element-mobilizing transposase RayT
MLWLVTFVTHNSRLSQRMERYHIRPGDPFILNPEDQLLVATAIAEQAWKSQIGLAAYNVLPDHVHMIAQAESEIELSDHVRRTKGYTSHVVRKSHGVQGDCHIWAQKFNRRLIPDGEALQRTIQYVMDNHLKHQAMWGERLIPIWDEKLRPVVESACSRLT